MLLTEEGKRYLKDGLPERRLEKVLISGAIDLKTAKNLVKDFSIALQWCKEYGCVEIKDGRMYLKKKLPEETARIEKALKAIAASPGADMSGAGREAMEILLRRKLAKEKDQESHNYKHKDGKEIADVTENLIKSGAWKESKFRPYNVSVPGKRIYPGKRHPYSKFLWGMRRKLIEMGFIEMRGSTIEPEFWNFDALFQPQNHPARDWTQTYSLKNPKSGNLPDKKIVKNVAAYHERGWKYKWSEEKAKQLMPTAHDTAVSPRTLSSKNLEIPGKYFQLVRCYRPDVIDATHGVEFNQMGGIIVAEGLNFRDLLGLLKTFAVEVGGCDPKTVRFLPDYYPFTEPSVQISARHPDMGWVELAGAGIFREELTKPLGVEAPVLAWGFGVDRLAIYKLGINDVRDLFSSNLNWLRNQVL